MLASNLVPVASVNLSPIQLKAPGFSASVAILGETGVLRGRLAFEITEGLEMEMDSDILRCISDLKMLGIRIWLDDFGTGFAGLSWLRLIDFDTVKIDRSFLHDCGEERGKAMLQDIIGLIRNRGHESWWKAWRQRRNSPSCTNSASTRCRATTSSDGRSPQSGFAPAPPTRRRSMCAH